MTVSNRKEYIEAAKAAFLKLAMKQVITKMTAKFVFLAWGPLAPLFAMLVEKILTEAIEGGETAIFFVYIDFRVNGQSKDFVEAALNNYRIQQTGTQEEKDEAESKLITAFDSFVKLNNY